MDIRGAVRSVIINNAAHVKELIAALRVSAPEIGPVLRPRVELRKWRSGRLSVYNGFTHEERVAGWQRSKWLQDSRALPAPSECVICGSQKNLEYHSETYFDPTLVQAVCKSCHRRIHLRFRFPDAWARWVESVSKPSWIKVLASDRRDLRHGFRLDACNSTANFSVQPD